MAAHLSSHLQQHHLSQSISATSHCDSSASSSSPDAFPPFFSGLFRARSDRRRSVSISTGDSSLASDQFDSNSGHQRRGSFLKKLAGGPRDNARRFLRLGIPNSNHSSSSSSSSTTPPPPLPPLSLSLPHSRPMPRTSRPRPVSEIVISPRDAQMLAASAADINHGGRMRSDSSSTTASAHHQPQAILEQPSAPESSQPFPPLPHEKTVATGSGISVGIALTEPMLFLAGYDQSDPTTKKSAILRGQLHLSVTKSVKIKKISICFRGHAQTDWPDGM